MLVWVNSDSSPFSRYNPHTNGPQLVELLRRAGISYVFLGDQLGGRPASSELYDPEARPLSGIGQADVIIEMPVTPNSVTRFMAVYQCQTPKEIGSVRSAREDFIPLAAGFNTIYAHWASGWAVIGLLRTLPDPNGAARFEP